MTTTRTPEAKARLAMALAEIEAHPERWDQSVWRCGSKACLMGTYVDIHPGVAWETNAVAGLIRIVNTGEVEYIGSWGAQELGLSDVEFDELTSDFNSMDDLRRFVAQYIDDEDIYPLLDEDRDWWGDDE